MTSGTCNIAIYGISIWLAILEMTANGNAGNIYGCEGQYHSWENGGIVGLILKE